MASAIFILAALLAAAIFAFAHLYFLPFRLGPAPERLLPEGFFAAPPSRFPDIRLYIDGREAFDAVFEAIGSAVESVHIQTFIWKDDALGGRMVDAVLAAADRGVDVTLSKDILGTFFEIMNDSGKPSPLFNHTGLRMRPNIRLTLDYFKPVNHSKYFIIDGKTAIFGGMNVASEYHEVWHDYMIGLYDTALAKSFAGKTAAMGRWPEEAPFVIADNSPKAAQIRVGLLEVIANARQRLVFQHAFFSADIILEAVEAALARGTRVDILLPRAPATHNPANRASINRLLSGADAGRLRVFLYPKMSHAKALVADERIVAIGSANLTPRSLCVSGETELFAHFPPDHPFIARLNKRIEEDISNSELVTAPFVMGAGERARAMVGKYIW